MFVFSAAGIGLKLAGKKKKGERISAAASTLETEIQKSGPN